MQMKRSKELLLDLVPPVITRIARKSVRRRQTARPHVTYATWEDARRHATGYDDPVILEKVASAALKVKCGDAAFERDSVLFESVQYSWPVLAGLLWVASSSGNKLNVLDFGGSLGTSYFQNRAFLEHISDLRWS